VTKKDLLKEVQKFVKYVNTNKADLGFDEDLMIAPKLEVPEIEGMVESIGESVAEYCGEQGTNPEEFVNLYESLAESFDAYKEANPESATPEESENPAPPEEKTPVGKTTGTGSAAPKGVVKTQEKSAPTASKSKPKKTAPTKSTVASDDKDKAIKKLYDLLPADVIAELDLATARTILSVMK